MVAERRTERPYPRSARVAERPTVAARDRGLLVYPSTGCADGTAGDLVLLGHPFVIEEAELATVTDRLAAAVTDATAGLAG